MTTDLTPQGAAAVRLAADVVRLKRERDRARGIAVSLEQQVAQVEALCDLWDGRRDGIFSGNYDADTAAAGALYDCVGDFRAALEGDQ